MDPVDQGAAAGLGTVDASHFFESAEPGWWVGWAYMHEYDERAPAPAYVCLPARASFIVSTTTGLRPRR